MCNCCAGMMLPFVEGNSTKLAKEFSIFAASCWYILFLLNSGLVDMVDKRALPWQIWQFSDPGCTLFIFAADGVLSCDLGGSSKETWLVTVDVETYMFSTKIFPFVSPYISPIYRITTVCIPDFDFTHSTGIETRPRQRQSLKNGAHVIIAPEKWQPEKHPKFGRGWPAGHS